MHRLGLPLISVAAIFSPELVRVCTHTRGATSANAPPTPPAILYEYQRKRLTKIAFHKPLILKSAILVALELWERRRRCWEERKAGASARTPDAVIYRVNYTPGYTIVKENFTVYRKPSSPTRTWFCFH